MFCPPLQKRLLLINLQWRPNGFSITQMVQSATRWCENVIGCLFPLERPPPIQKRSPTHILGGTIFEAQLGPPKPTVMFFFRLKVPNLQILEIGNLPATRHFLQLHHPNSPAWFNFGPLVSLISTKVCSRTALRDLSCLSVTVSKNICKYRVITTKCICFF